MALTPGETLLQIRLFKNRFQSFHDRPNKDPSDIKTWLLDGTCSLHPASAADIFTPKQRTVRPAHTWTITATVTKSGLEQVQLVGLAGNWRGRRVGARSEGGCEGAQAPHGPTGLTRHRRDPANTSRATQ